MVTPTGGDKDIDAPKLLNATIIESSKNEFSKTISFEFDEYAAWLAFGFDTNKNLFYRQCRANL